MRFDLKNFWEGYPSKDWIYASEHFIVFINEKDEVDWETTQEYDQLGPKDQKKQNEILNDAATIESIPSEHLDSGKRDNFKRLIGEALARSFEHDYENAKKMLEKAKAYIQARNQEESRLWYLSASGIITLGFFLGGILCWIIRDYLSILVGELAFALIISGVAGACGALFSVIMRMGNSNLDSAAGKKLHYLDAGYRILAGFFGAIFIALSVKLGIIFPIFSNVENTHIAMLFAGFIAGASERLAPSIINKIEGNLNKTEVNLSNEISKTPHSNNEEKKN